MVASRVDVRTRSMLPGAEPVVWRSTGSGTFTVLPGEREQPGTEIVLHLKEDEREYLKVWRVKDIIKKYSDFVQFPIYVNDELMNRSSAIWALPKSQVTDEQHTEFFRRITGVRRRRRRSLRVHMSVDAPVQFHALLYVPEKAPLDLFQQGAPRPAPLRQARAHRRGLRQARRRLTSASCAAWSTPRTSLSTSRARCCKRIATLRRSSSSSPSSVLQAR